jgi:hypothetical protein
MSDVPAPRCEDQLLLQLREKNTGRRTGLHPSRPVPETSLPVLSA